MVHVTFLICKSLVFLGIVDPSHKCSPSQNDLAVHHLGFFRNEFYSKYLEDIKADVLKILAAGGNSRALISFPSVQNIFLHNFLFYF